MTFEFVNSDIRNARDKEKKAELRLLDESDIKKVGSGKKSWLDIIEEYDLIKDHKTEIVDKSGISHQEDHKVGVKKSGLEFVARERIVNCERQRDGLANNCAFCKELSKDRFDRCPNKYGGF